MDHLRILLEAAAAVEALFVEWEILRDCRHRIVYPQHASLHAPDTPLAACGDCGRRRRVIGSVPVNEVLSSARRAEEART